MEVFHSSMKRIFLELFGSDSEDECGSLSLDDSNHSKRLIVEEDRNLDSIHIVVKRQNIVEDRKDHASYSTCRNTSCYNPWITQPETEDALSFAQSNLPSRWVGHDVSWIYLRQNNSNQITSRKSLCGKWMWFLPAEKLDTSFVAVAASLQNGALGHAAKCPPPNSTGYTPIIIFTQDFTNTEDVLRVGLELRRIGAEGRLSYKPDVFTTSEFGIHGSMELKYKSIYELPANREELERVGGGEAMECAMSCNNLYDSSYLSNERILTSTLDSPASYDSRFWCEMS